MSKLTCLKRITDGGLGAEPPATEQFFVIFWKKLAILMPLDHNSLVFRTILKNL